MMARIILLYIEPLKRDCMPRFYVITDIDETAAHLPLYKLTAETSTGEWVTIHVHAPDAAAAKHKALMPGYQPAGITIRQVLTVEEFA